MCLFNESTDEPFWCGGIRGENGYLRETGGLVLALRGLHVEQISFTNWPGRRIHFKDPSASYIAK